MNFTLWRAPIDNDRYEKDKIHTGRLPRRKGV